MISGIFAVFDVLTIPYSEKKIIFMINTSKSQKLPELESIF